MKVLPLAALGAAALLAGPAGASSSPQNTQGSARAFSIKIVLPDGPGAGTAAATAPPSMGATSTLSGRTAGRLK
jgi:hypothetical protein